MHSIHLPFSSTYTDPIAKREIYSKRIPSMPLTTFAHQEMGFIKNRRPSFIFIYSYKNTSKRNKLIALNVYNLHSKSPYDFLSWKETLSKFKMPLWQQSPCMCCCYVASHPPDSENPPGTLQIPGAFVA